MYPCVKCYDTHTLTKFFTRRGDFQVSKTLYNEFDYENFSIPAFGIGNKKKGEGSNQHTQDI
jgi:hypothetical protein